MLRTIAHRGPDDEGQLWRETRLGWLGLGNRRLAVLDLSQAGHQPMERAGRLLTYNGEIYNFMELRKELERAGEAFAGGTDTEVVLALLNRDGVDGLRRLNGMFALAWWDAPNCELVVARDRFGIKPLYYRHGGGELVFASEAKCLFAAGLSAEFDRLSLPSYLAFGWVPGAATLFKGVQQLPPGHILRHSTARTLVESFRRLAPSPDTSMTRRDAARAVRSGLTDAVGRQMVADVPVGVMLSGGLDSTAIAALAVRASSTKVAAFSIAFRPQDALLEQSVDDSRFARVASDKLGLELHEIQATPRVADLLERVTWHLDDPVADPAAILTLLISEAAASEVTVLLSGQGSDEIFGGYRINGYNRTAELIEHQPRWLCNAESRAVDWLPALAARLPGWGRPGLVLAAHRASRMVFDELGVPPEDRYIAWRSAYHFVDGGLGGLLEPDAAAELAHVDPAATHRHLFADHGTLGFFDRMLLVDQATFLLSQNLTYSDRLSMAASIELRVPFLDDALADAAARVPEHLKLRHFQRKVVLRDAMRGIVPDEIIRRRKAGFGLPIRSWLRDDLRPLMEDALSPAWLADIGCFQTAAVRKLIDQHVTGVADHTYRIWTLLSLSMWWSAHIHPKDQSSRAAR